jgi:hypothetical protein
MLATSCDSSYLPFQSVLNNNQAAEKEEVVSLAAAVVHQGFEWSFSGSSRYVLLWDGKMCSEVQLCECLSSMAGSFSSSTSILFKPPVHWHSLLSEQLPMLLSQVGIRLAPFGIHISLMLPLSHSYCCKYHTAPYLRNVWSV